MMVTGTGCNPTTEAEMMDYHKDLQHGGVTMEAEQYPSTQEDLETGYSSDTMGRD